MSRACHAAGASTFNTGVVEATALQPAGNPATYDGSSDLDWWYLPTVSDLEPDGSASEQPERDLHSEDGRRRPGSAHADHQSLRAVDDAVPVEHARPSPRRRLLGSPQGDEWLPARTCARRETAGL